MFRAAATERPQKRLGNAHELCDPIAHRQPLEAEVARQLGAQHRLVDEARRASVRV